MRESVVVEAGTPVPGEGFTGPGPVQQIHHHFPFRGRAGGSHDDAGEAMHHHAVNPVEQEYAGLSSQNRHLYRLRTVPVVAHDDGRIRLTCCLERNLEVDLFGAIDVGDGADGSRRAAHRHRSSRQLRGKGRCGGDEDSLHGAQSRSKNHGQFSRRHTRRVAGGVVDSGRAEQRRTRTPTDLPDAIVEGAGNVQIAGDVHGETERSIERGCRSRAAIAYEVCHAGPGDRCNDAT